MKVTYTKNRFEIDGVQIINPELLPITTYVNYVLNLGSSLVHNETQNVINEGDSFSLPDNIIAEKVYIEPDDSIHCNRGVDRYRLKLKELLVDTGSKETQEQILIPDGSKWGITLEQVDSKLNYDKIKEVNDALGEPGIGSFRIVENQFLADDMIIVSSKIYKALKVNP